MGGGGIEGVGILFSNTLGARQWRIGSFFSGHSVHFFKTVLQIGMNSKAKRTKVVLYGAVWSMVILSSFGTFLG